MSGSHLLNELNSICAEICSEKITIRNKAAERLDNILTNSKSDLFHIFQNRSISAEVSWTTLFNSSINALLKHAAKVEESKDSKSIQTLRNKNHIFCAIVNKLIDYDLEDKRNISKSTLLSAFFDGFSNRSAVKCFGSLFLYILDSGIYKSPDRVSELQVNEFSRILSHLFEINVRNDENVRFGVLRSVNKTIELALRYVQLNTDLVDYFPEIEVYATIATDDRRKAEVIKLFSLFISQLLIDYHNMVCAEIQKLLPTLCGFYNFRMKIETKELFFTAVYNSLVAIYPHIKNKNCDSINVSLRDNWSKTLKRLETIVEMEIKDRKNQLYRPGDGSYDKCLESFVKMSATLMFLVHWNVQQNACEDLESRRKVPKTADKIETVLSFVQPQCSSVNETWLNIMAELISSYETVLNFSNFQEVLKATFQILSTFNNASSLRSIRIIISSILQLEVELLTKKSIPENFCQEIWVKIVEFLISDSSSNSTVINEKQLLLQMLVKYGKLSLNDVNTLFNTFLANKSLKRTECIVTVREVLINANTFGMEKISELVCRVISWICETRSKIDAKSVLLNIAPINVDLLADTAAIAVINFMDENENFGATENKSQDSPNFKLLLYKYNRELLCMEHEIENQNKKTSKIQQSVNENKNCLFQSNYELLMRLVNFETTTETSVCDISIDLSHLNTLSSLMYRFLMYGVFSKKNYTLCPLIKRMGFFLNHLEYQFKHNSPQDIDRSDLLDLLQQIETYISIFTSNSILLKYLEAQPLEEQIIFVANSLKFSASQHLCSEFDDWSKISHICLRILAMLCSSTTHFKNAFEHILQHKLNIKTDFNNVSSLIEIICNQKHFHDDVALWICDNLKTICQLYHNNIEISERVVELLPATIQYVQREDTCLQNMFIILSSFLKKSYRKSYSSQFAAKIVEAVRQIAKQCHGICDEPNFRKICFSVAKFITSPSLEIQFAAINTITALMDANWLCIAISQNVVHAEFSEKIMSQIDYKSLAATTNDNKLNGIAVTIQLLVGVFICSTYHQEIALNELAYFCALRKLNESDFLKFREIASFVSYPLSELTKHYMPNLIHKWIEKQYPILKFPYYLCATTRDEFMLKNMPVITSCTLIYLKPDQLKKFDKFNTQDELIDLAYPIVQAAALTYQSGCSLLDSSLYESNMKRLFNNLEVLGIHLLNNNRSSQMDWRTVYQILSLFSDEDHFQNMFGFSHYFPQKKWFHIDYESLLKCLKYYISLEYKSCASFSTMISKDSLGIVNVFSALKENIASAYFLTDQLKYFHLYSTFAKIILDSIEVDTTESSEQNSEKYLVRDIIYFISYILHGSQATPKMQIACFVVLRQLLSTSFFKEGLCDDILRCHLHIIIKALVFTAENTACSDVRESAISTMHTIISENMIVLSEAISLLDDFPNDERYEKLHQILSSESSDEEKDMHTIVKSFLQMQNFGAEGIKAIANNKSELQREIALFYKLIKRLIEIVRCSKNYSYALEATKCLGEIGALKLKEYSYFFETDVSFYDSEAILKDPMEYFTKSMLKAVEKMLFTYSAQSHSIVCQVLQQLVNCREERSLMDMFPQLNIFQWNSNKKSYLETYSNTEPIDMISILKITEKLSFEKWVSCFVSKIYKYFGWKDFEELSICDYSFAESSLIPLFKLLVSKKDLHLDIILSVLDYFFKEVYDAITSSTVNSTSIYTEKRVIKQFLSICECIRMHNEWKLPINLLYVARACNYCQAYFLSILYLEMWSIYEKCASTDKTNIEILSNELFQEVSTKAYSSIGCSDAISGFLNPLNSRLEFLDLDGNWSDVLLHADATGITTHPLYANNLKKNGVFSLANLIQTNKCVDYEICWRLCQWETSVESHSTFNNLNDMEKEFEKHHFNALKCIYNREEINSVAAISNARNCVMSILKEISIECLQSVYKYLTWLHMLQQAEDFCQVQFATSVEITSIFQKWKCESEMQYGSFWCKEQVLSHQITLYKTAGVRANRKIMEFYKDNNPVELCLLKCINECKQAGEINLAIRNITDLKNMQLSNEQIRVSALLEDAEICFKTGKPVISNAILQHILKNKDFAYCVERVRAFRMQGEYLMESNTETFETVLRSFFKGSINLIKQLGKVKDQIILKNRKLFNMESFDTFESKNLKYAYATIAKYADREYNQLNIFVNSEEFQIKCKIINENRQAADSVGKQNKDRDKNIGALFMKKFANLDEKEVQNVKQKCTEYLCIAIENYMKFCKIDQAITSPTIYRIIALWFANKQNESLHMRVSQNITEIPTYKFICTLNQMTARLNSKNTEFLILLKDILIRCVQDHPHHTLYQLYPLVFAFTDSSNTKSNDRVSIAKDIINNAKNKSNSLSIKQMENMFPALIDFANEKVTENNTVLNDKLRRMKNLNSVQCPTVELPISINKEYKITSIIQWEDKVSLVGGINAPKKITCLCSDGQSRAQLLKGKDDLRQDAVMQQVFSMINDLLRSEPETKKHQLNLRTYKVVPLSMRSGILEWCQNTIPIGVYLQGAHKKYRPNDYTIQKCRTMSMQHLKSDSGKRLEMFLHICSNIKPVFHFFFFEKFLVPGVWFERRLAYINSVATTSIVGFVLGLGDRHTQNILIDEKTAEVIHIDFGIAFEQGKIMPTPETVPFRLTRDMVAPMGICGTNGVFKKSCEATMAVLRRNQAVITTILEVLLYDPLYIWKVVPQTSSENSHEQTNLTAQRALLCVQNKLEGKQTGIFGTSGVDVQVQRLINEAVLNDNLCMLYPGWDPYL